VQRKAKLARKTGIPNLKFRVRKFPSSEDGKMQNKLKWKKFISEQGLCREKLDKFSHNSYAMVQKESTGNELFRELLSATAIARV
jgi:hypothetical protein